jgi:hypothetical protein
MWRTTVTAADAGCVAISEDAISEDAISDEQANATVAARRNPEPVARMTASAPVRNR